MPRSETSDGIAIVGMACLLPGATTLQSYFGNVLEGRSALAEMPAGRLDPIYYETDGDEPNRFACRQGGFIDAYAYFDAAAHGVMPIAAQRTEPDQLLALDVALRALKDAGYRTAEYFDRRRAGVILGRGGHGASGHARAEQDTRGAEQLAAALESLLPELPAPKRQAIKREFQARVGAPRSDGAIGMIPNLAASRIAHRLDLKGPAYTVDGACASSVLALDQAVLELRSGRADLMLTGGLAVCHTESFWSVFHHLGALSRSQTLRPFDQRADGLLIGEGIGIVVLKREADALRDCDRIYAVVRGVGISSDGHAASLVSPSTEGQQLALARAWSQSGLEPGDIALLEAHGTGTPLGDATELQTLSKFFGAACTRPAAIGSVKAMIGHTMAAAGAAGLIKAALCLFHRVLPPAANCEQPRPELDETRFRPLNEPQDGSARAGVAAVNAFGFGGINGHVVLARCDKKAWRAGVKAPVAPQVPVAPQAPPQLLLFAADSRSELIRKLRQREVSLNGRHRLALLDPTPERLQRAIKLVERGTRVHGEGIATFYSGEPLLRAGGKVAFVFPGVNDDPALGVEHAAAFFGRDLDIRAHAGELGHGLRVVEVNHVLLHALRAIDLRPDLVAGHSLGEWSAMVAAGLVDEATRARLVRSISSAGAVEAQEEIVAAALFCSAETAAGLLEGLSDIDISHDNCRTQVVVCGAPSSVATACRRARHQKLLVRELNYSSGVHTARFERWREQFDVLSRTVPFESPHTPVYSAVLCAPYPEDRASIAELSTRMLVEPVRFRHLIDRLYADGARVFVQVGAGPVSGFIKDTLAEREHVAVASASGTRPALRHLTFIACALWSEGGEPDWSRLPVRAPFVPCGQRLQLGVPLVRFEPLRLEVPAPAGGAPSGVNPRGLASVSAPPVAAAAADLLERLDGAQHALASLLESRPSAPTRVVRSADAVLHRSAREISLHTFPELRDHAFYLQAEGWPDVRDTHPVMPLTGIVELMIDAAFTCVGRAARAVAVEAVEAYRWLLAAESQEAIFLCTRRGDRVDVEIEGFARGTVVLAGDYPPPPTAPAPALGTPRLPVPRARDVYADRWMFHGPAYRGIADIEALGAKGIAGSLCCGDATGALLDSAAQLFGVWFMHELTADRLAMPVRLRCARFYSRQPRPGTRVDCLARPSSVQPRAVIGELTLSVAGRVWAHLEGWEARRLDVDEALWRVITWPEKQLLSERLRGDDVVFHDRYRSAMTQDYLRSRYLRCSEREHLARLPPGAQRRWLNGRIAAKDAVRAHLWQQGGRPMFPAEILLRGEGEVLDVVEPRGCAMRVPLDRRGDTTTARLQPLRGEQS